MRIAIIDDEKSEQLLLEKYVLEWGHSHYHFIEVVFFPNSESFLFSWEEDKLYDLLILDIEMGEMNGVELAKCIRKEDEKIPIMFATGYDDYMALGYDVSAIHYLMKPIDKDKLFGVLNRIWKEKKEEDKLFFETIEGNLNIESHKIWYIEAAKHQCILWSESKELVLKESLGAVEEKLKDKVYFVKCHRSYIVNLNHVAAVLKKEILLDNQIALPLSRYVSKQFNEAFISYYRKENPFNKK